MSAPGGLGPEQVASLVRAIGVNKIVDYVALVTITIVFFDYFNTFPREVNLMWRSKFSLPKVLYFVCRYYIMVHSLLWITYHADDKLSGTRCNYPFSRNSVSSHLVLVFCEAISYVRVYAFSGGNKYLLVFLGLHFLAVNVVGFYYVAIFIRSAAFMDLPPDLRLGCFPIKANGFALAMVVITLLVSLLSVTAVMVFYGIKRFRSMSGRSNLVGVFYQDGIFYFLCLSAIQITNMTIFLLAPANGMQLLFVQPQVHLSALLATRMLLHLREHAANQQVILMASGHSNVGIPFVDTRSGGSYKFEQPLSPHGQGQSEYVMDDLKYQRK